MEAGREAEVAVANGAAAIALPEITKKTLLLQQNIATTPAMNLLTRTCIPRARDIAAVEEVAVCERVEALPVDPRKDLEVLLVDPRSRRLTDILEDLDHDPHHRIAAKLN